ncbi:unnamed protein product [Gongylonema pulchrum]|uniref:RING-type E3 ubiquitin transferase n=1 Tax=Gongylonema pulchrum TaxID=637853 RepID=A0A183E450_9BILA|nr:unnamed protein product [Gongylonema pulchrum]
MRRRKILSSTASVVCLKCGHLFGQSCIERWIRRNTKNASCPQCKERARLTDIRRLYTSIVKALDTTELEHLKEANNEYKIENEYLRVENEYLKMELSKAEASKSASMLVTRAVQTPDVGHYLSLVMDCTVPLYMPQSSRSIDGNSKFFVITCKLPAEHLMPYGLKMLTHDGHEVAVIGIHEKRPRCCKFSPYDPDLVLSTGEDHMLCVTRFGNTATLVHREQLPFNGWSCCWLSANEVAVGLINGRVLKFNIMHPGKDPALDITSNNGIVPIISVHSSPTQSLLFVVSLKECVLYEGMQRYVLISNQGAISAFCYDEGSCHVMLTFAPGQYHSTVTHVLYKLVLNSQSKQLLHVCTYESDSSKLTCMTKSAFWFAPVGPLAVIYNEADSKLVSFDLLQPLPAMFLEWHNTVTFMEQEMSHNTAKFGPFHS